MYIIQRASSDGYEDDFVSRADGEWRNSSKWVIAITIFLYSEN
jgi:hypothetical protein